LAADERRNAILYCGATNMKFESIEFSYTSDLALVICVPLLLKTPQQKYKHHEIVLWLVVQVLINKRNTETRRTKSGVKFELIHGYVICMNFSM